MTESTPSITKCKGHWLNQEDLHFSCSIRKKSNGDCSSWYFYNSFKLGGDGLFYSCGAGSGPTCIKGSQCSCTECPTPPPPPPTPLCNKNEKTYASCIWNNCKNQPLVFKKKDFASDLSLCTRSNTLLDLCGSSIIYKILDKDFNNPSGDCLDIASMCATGNKNNGVSRKLLYVVLRIDDMGMQDYGSFYKTNDILKWSLKTKVPINIGIMGQNYMTGGTPGSNGFKPGENYTKDPTWNTYMNNKHIITGQDSDSNLPRPNTLWEFFNHGYIHTAQIQRGQTGCSTYAKTIDPSCSWQYNEYNIHGYRIIDLSNQEELIINNIFKTKLGADIHTFVPPHNVIDISSLIQIDKYKYHVVSLAETSGSTINIPCNEVFQNGTKNEGKIGISCENTDKGKMKQGPNLYNFFGAHANSANSYFNTVAQGIPVNSVLDSGDCYSISISKSEQERLNDIMHDFGHAHNKSVIQKSNPVSIDDTDDICPLLNVQTYGSIQYSVLMMHAFTQFNKPSGGDIDYYTWLDLFYKAAMQHDTYDISFVTFSTLKVKLLSEQLSEKQITYIGAGEHTIIYDNIKHYVIKGHLSADCFMKGLYILYDPELYPTVLGKMINITTIRSGLTIVHITS